MMKVNTKTFSMALSLNIFQEIKPTKGVYISRKELDINGKVLYINKFAFIVKRQHAT
jgi:hypothetical protein